MLSAQTQYHPPFAATPFVRQADSQPLGYRLAETEDALFEGSMISLATGRGDAMLTEIQQKGDHAVNRYMFIGSPRVQSLRVALWGPLIDAARAQGKLKDGADTEAVVEWIRNIHAMLTMRDDYDDVTKRSMLKAFLVPSILAVNVRHQVAATRHSSGHPRSCLIRAR